MTSKIIIIKKKTPETFRREKINNKRFVKEVFRAFGKRWDNLLIIIFFVYKLVVLRCFSHAVVLEVYSVKKRII